jgi:outer membrane protein assembly factor BamB
LARWRDQLLIGVGSHVVALDYATGTEKWRTKLKTSSIVTVVVIGGRIFAGAAGEVFCLEPSSGKILWRNRLKGLGVGVVSFSSSDGAAAAAFAAAQAEAAG